MIKKRVVIKSVKKNFFFILLSLSPGNTENTSTPFADGNDGLTVGRDETNLSSSSCAKTIVFSK